MVFQPEVFVSAPQPELAPYREIVKDTLRSMGIKPVEHTDLNVAYGPLDGLLKLEIGACDAVVHLVGSTFGPEPPERTHGAVRRSFAQYEFDVARALNKDVLCFVTEPGTETAYVSLEEEEARYLQSDHRRMITKNVEHWKFANPETLTHLLRQLRPAVDGAAAICEPALCEERPRAAWTRSHADGTL
jgi:hypothetical protein